MRYAVLALIFGGVVAAGPASAQETFTVGVENLSYYPHYEIQKDGTWGGLGAAILNAFAKDQGYKLEYKPFPIARLFSEFVAGNVDLKYPDNAYWSADEKKGKNVIYSKPVVAYIDGVQVQPARLGRGVDDLKALGTVRGFTAWDWLDRIKSGKVRLEENGNLEGLLLQTIAGRVDGAYANVDVVANVLETVVRNPGALAFDASLPHTRSHYHLSTIGKPKVIEAFNTWLDRNADRIASMKTSFNIKAR